MSLTSKVILEKQPSEKINAAMDFTEWIPAGVTITSVASVAHEPDGLTLGDTNITDTDANGNLQWRVNFTISGGTAGINYRVEVVINTSDGEILEGDGILKVREI